LERNMSAPRILIVDDDVDMLETLAWSLGEKFDVTVAANGRLALRELDAHDFDAIVLDLNMPELGGEAVLEQLSHRRPAPAVILTSGMPVLPRVAATWRVHDWIRKPFRVDYLLHKLHEAVQH
jgi:DNA-binding response OmpR family regulator